MAKLTGRSISARELAHPGDLELRRIRVVAGDAGRRDFVDAGAEFLERLTDAEQLVLGGEGARDRLAVDRPVRKRPRGGEAQRAGLETFLDDRRHLLDVLGIGVLVARPAVAHHVCADGAVRDLGADVDRLGQRVQEVEVLGERLPAPLHALGQGPSRECPRRPPSGRSASRGGSERQARTRPRSCRTRRSSRRARTTA